MTAEAMVEAAEVMVATTVTTVRTRLGTQVVWHVPDRRVGAVRNASFNLMLGE